MTAMQRVNLDSNIYTGAVGAACGFKLEWRIKNASILSTEVRMAI